MVIGEATEFTFHGGTGDFKGPRNFSCLVRAWGLHFVATHFSETCLKSHLFCMLGGFEAFLFSS